MVEENKENTPVLEPEDMEPQEDDPDEYKDVYKMLSEMISLVKDNLNTDEEEKKSEEEDYDDEDDDSDGFGDDRDV